MEGSLVVVPAPSNHTLCHRTNSFFGLRVVRHSPKRVLAADSHSVALIDTLLAEPCAHLQSTRVDLAVRRVPALLRVAGDGHGVRDHLAWSPHVEPLRDEVAERPGSLLSAARAFTMSRHEAEGEAPQSVGTASASPTSLTRSSGATHILPYEMLAALNDLLDHLEVRTALRQQPVACASAQPSVGNLHSSIDGLLVDAAFMLPQTVW